MKSSFEQSAIRKLEEANKLKDEDHCSSNENKETLKLDERNEEKEKQYRKARRELMKKHLQEQSGKKKRVRDELASLRDDFMKFVEEKKRHEEQKRNEEDKEKLSKEKLAEFLLRNLAAYKQQDDEGFEEDVSSSTESNLSTIDGDLYFERKTFGPLRRKSENFYVLGVKKEFTVNR